MDTENDQIYKCDNCGMTVQVLEGSYGELVCCGVPMDLQDE